MPLASFARAGSKTDAIRFFEWSPGQGAAEASKLGYVPLPASLVEQIKGYWLANFGEHS